MLVPVESLDTSRLTTARVGKAPEDLRRLTSTELKGLSCLNFEEGQRCRESNLRHLLGQRLHLKGNVFYPCLTSFHLSTAA